MFKKIKKIHWIIIAVLLLVTSVVSIPFLFPDFITQKVKEYANSHLKGNLNFKDAHLSIIEHFPALTLSLDEFHLTGAQPFEKQDLIASKEIAFGIDIKELLAGKIHINKVFLDNAEIHVLVDKHGNANYNVYESEPQKDTKKEEETSIELEEIVINNAHISYDDASAQVKMDAQGFDYIGNGSLKNNIFEIKTKAKINAFDFVFKGEEYLKDKSVNADLITRVNTKSLAFVFEQDDLLINKLPVDFTGNFDFLPNGYTMNFLIKTDKSNLEDIFTALPPKLVTWMEHTQLKGVTDAVLALKGDFIAETNKKPDMTLDMKIKDGFIQYDGAPFPLEQFNMDLHVKLPRLDPELCEVNMPQIQFTVGKDYLKGNWFSRGVAKPYVKSDLNANLNLYNLTKALGIMPEYGIKGQLATQLKVDGVLDTKQNVLPLTLAKLDLKNGFLQTPHYPNPIQNIQAQSVVTIQKNLETTRVVLKPLRFQFEGQPMFVDADIKNLVDAQYNVKANGGLDFGKIYKVFGVKGHTVEGYAKGSVYLKGRQSDAQAGRLNKLVNKGQFYLRNVRTTTENLPLPFYIHQGLFKFDNDRLTFSNFKARYGHSNLNFNGYVQNVVNFLTLKNGVLKGTFDMKSPYLNVNEWMAPVGNTTSSTSKKVDTKGVVVLPKNFDFEFTTAIDKVLFDDLQIRCLEGKTTLKKGEVVLTDGKCMIIDSPFRFGGNYKAKNARRAQFGMDIAAEEFDVQRAYKEIKLFRDMASSASDAEGIISLNYQLKGVLNDDMFPIFPSLQGGGVVGVKKVKLKGFKLLKAVGGTTGHSGFDSGEVNDFEIKTCIQNNLIEIDRFKFKIAGFRPRIEGTTSFDGKLSLKMRLGLPPMGIIGIPLKVEGTKDKPKVRIGSKTQGIQGEQYNENTEDAD